MSSPISAITRYSTAPTRSAALPATTRWTGESSPRNTGRAAIRYGPEESLDLLLAAEEPDIGRDDDGRPDDTGWDENATEEDIARLSLEQDPEPRAGRLAAEDEVVYDADEAYLIGHDDRLARDESIDGGGASAEEAAIHYRTDES